MLKIFTVNKQGIVGFVVASLALFLTLTAATAKDLKVERLATQKYSVFDIEQGERVYVNRVNLPYFDADNGIQWNRLATSTPPSDFICPSLADSRGVLAHPRVDIWRCADKAYLVGIAANGEQRWIREMAYLLDSYRFTQDVAGANESSLTLSNLETWSPETGKTLPPSALVYDSASGRRGPKFGVHYAAVYHASSGDYFTYDPSGTIFHDKGGLYRMNAASGASERLMSKSSSFLAPIDIRAIQIDASGRYLLLGEHWGSRGTNWVRFVIFDLEKRQRVFEEKHGQGTNTSQPRIVVGQDGDVAFSYLSNNEHVLVHYRIID